MYFKFKSNPKANTKIHKWYISICKIWIRIPIKIATKIMNTKKLQDKNLYLHGYNGSNIWHFKESNSIYNRVIKIKE